MSGNVEPLTTLHSFQPLLSFCLFSVSVSSWKGRAVIEQEDRSVNKGLLSGTKVITGVEKSLSHKCNNSNHRSSLVVATRVVLL